MGETWSPRGQGALRPSFQDEQKDREDSHVETFQIRRSSLSIQDAATLQWGAELESCWEECQRPTDGLSKSQGMNGDLFFSLLGVVQTHCRYINGCHKQEEEICDLPWDWTNFLLVSVSGVLAATLNSGRLYCIDWKMITWYCFDDVSYWFDQKWCVPQFIKKTKVKHHDSRGSPAMFSDQPTTWTAGSVN